MPKLNVGHEFPETPMILLLASNISYPTGRIPGFRQTSGIPVLAGPRRIESRGYLLCVFLRNTRNDGTEHEQLAAFQR